MTYYNTKDQVNDGRGLRKNTFIQDVPILVPQSDTINIFTLIVELH